MWQELVQQVGIFWIILVFLATAGLIALTVVFFLTLHRLTFSSKKKFNTLNQVVDGLERCRIENLDPVKESVEATMPDPFKACFKRFTEDSEAMFGSLWVPDPNSRLPLADVLPEPVRAVFRKSLGSAVIFGGVAVSAVALSTGFVLHGSLIDSTYIRFFGLMPLIVSGLGMLVLHQASDQYYRQVQQAWKRLMITLERKLPVYTQAAETASLLNRMKDYDAKMSKATLTLAEQVQSLASGKLTDAVTNAVKYVMSATVGPAVVKSSEALALLAQQLEKQMQQSDHMVVKLYSELEMRQKKQSDLWLKRYQEIAEVLSEQQASLLNNLSASEQQLVDSLAKSQTFALEKIVNEQKETLQQMNGVSQRSWSLLQEKLTSIITQLSEGQQRLLVTLNDQQQQTLTKVSSSSEKTAETLRTQYEAIIKQLTDFQALAYENLLVQQKESFSLVNEQQIAAYEKATRLQKEGLDQIQLQQEATLQKLTESQLAVLQEVDQRQAGAIQLLSTEQSKTLMAISEQQTMAMQQLTANQSENLVNIRRRQDDTLAIMAKNQNEALQQLADNFAGQVSGTLSTYLDPISQRLQDSSESLIAAQVYAKDVKDVLKLQNEAATTLQVSIGDLFSQLVETRRTMSEDLVSLKASSKVMSQAAESMSSVYAGSQSGLSEAISQMSNDLMRLSDVLSAVMAGSAEQTRLMQTQSLETYEINQKHLDSVRSQITLLSDELSTRIDQLMLGFSNLTEDLVKNVNANINAQNDTLGGSLRSLTEIMGEEARSMSLFAQQINMDIESLNTNLRSAVSEFDSGMRGELTTVLSQFDAEVADIVKRLAQSAGELGDAVEALPEAIRHASQSGQTGSTSSAS